MLKSKNLNLRLPVKIHEKSVELAEHEKRSLNSFIINAIEFYINNQYPTPPDAPELEYNLSKDTLEMLIRDLNPLYKSIKDDQNKNSSDK